TKDTPDTIRVQTFGNFEIFVGGKAMKFKRSRSKEVLAYLIDRQGAGACTRELAAVIWGDEPYTRSRQKQMQVLIHELCKTL
ncbi:MAG: two-component system response regulator, partial [Eubacterium sp.]